MPVELQIGKDEPHCELVWDSVASLRQFMPKIAVLASDTPIRDWRGAFPPRHLLSPGDDSSKQETNNRIKLVPYSCFEWYTQTMYILNSNIYSNSHLTESNIQRPNARPPDPKSLASPQWANNSNGVANGVPKAISNENANDRAVNQAPSHISNMMQGAFDNINIRSKRNITDNGSDNINVPMGYFAAPANTTANLTSGGCSDCSILTVLTHPDSNGIYNQRTMAHLRGSSLEGGLSDGNAFDLVNKFRQQIEDSGGGKVIWNAGERNGRYGIGSALGQEGRTPGSQPLLDLMNMPGVEPVITQSRSITVAPDGSYDFGTLKGEVDSEGRTFSPDETLGLLRDADDTAARTFPGASNDVRGSVITQDEQAGGVPEESGPEGGGLAQTLGTLEQEGETVEDLEALQIFEVLDL